MLWHFTEDIYWIHCCCFMWDLPSNFEMERYGFLHNLLLPLVTNISLFPFPRLFNFQSYTPYTIMLHQQHHSDKCLVENWLHSKMFLERNLQSLFIQYCNQYFPFFLISQILFMQVCSSNIVGNLLRIAVWSICSRLAVQCISLYFFFASNWRRRSLHGESTLHSPLSYLYRGTI
jgi:hypothetical protein